MATAKITKKLLDHLRKSAVRVDWWDTDLPGFLARVYTSGTISFALRAQQPNGLRHRIPIGKYGPLTVDQARAQARELLRDITLGQNPAQARRDRREAPTVALFAGEYMERHSKVHKKPSSVRSDENILKNQILPRLGQRKMADITLPDVQRFHSELTEIPTRANRALALLSHMMAWAEKHGVRPVGSNPCSAVDRYPERKNTRYLSPAETKRLADHLNEASSSADCDKSDAIRLLLLTGCRKEEIVGMTWAEVDLDAQMLRLQDTKTGFRLLPLGGLALEILQRRYAVKRASTWVFPNENGTGPTGTVDRFWRKIRGKAGLEGVRLHDLRHTFAAGGIHAGLTLPEVGALLGNKTPAATARYAHIADEVKASASARTAKQLESMMQTGKPRLRMVS